MGGLERPLVDFQKIQHKRDMVILRSQLMMPLRTSPPLMFESVRCPNTETKPRKQAFITTQVQMIGGMSVARHSWHGIFPGGKTCRGLF